MKNNLLLTAFLLAVAITSCDKDEPTEPVPTPTPTEPTPTPTPSQCAEEIMLSMYGKMYGQIADTSKLNGSTVFPYPHLVQYFKITDSTSAGTITSPCKGAGKTWDNLEKRLFYYFERHEVDGAGKIYANGKVEFGLGSTQGDYLYGKNCSLHVPIYGPSSGYCPLFYMDNVYTEDDHLMSMGTMKNDLKFVKFTDSIYVIDIHRINMEEYFRDTAVYYLIK